MTLSFLFWFWSFFLCRLHPRLQELLCSTESSTALPTVPSMYTPLDYVISTLYVMSCSYYVTIILGCTSLLSLSPSLSLSLSFSLFLSELLSSLPLSPPLSIPPSHSSFPPLSSLFFDFKTIISQFSYFFDRYFLDKYAFHILRSPWRNLTYVHVHVHVHVLRSLNNLLTS